MVYSIVIKKNVMGLDYTDGCVNFRDIGGYINLIVEKSFYQKVAYFVEEVLIISIP